MKKLLLPILATLLFSSCQKQISKEIVASTEDFPAIQGSSSKAEVCHRNKNGTWQTISINMSAVPAHLAHGDVVPDADADGYTKANPCGTGSQDDCDDTNPAINPAATEITGNGIDENCNGMGDDVIATIGSPYQGGIIAYIFQPGDPGYIAGQFHGLIAAPEDQRPSLENPAVQWYNGNYLLIGTSTEFGTGMTNTNSIVLKQGDGIYAAKLCRDYTGGGYTDWFLPSKDELNKLWDNLADADNNNFNLGPGDPGNIGNFDDRIYWSSSEFDTWFAWYQNFQHGDHIGNDGKSNNSYRVRAVRYF